jgi:hypothetical protein
MAVTENHLGEIADDFEDILNDALDKLAFDAEAGYKMMIQSNGQIDTRNMLESCFAVTSRSTTWQPGRDREDPPASKPLTSYAGISASYAWYQNYGTRYIPARPFFEPVNERISRQADQVVELIRKRLMRFES